VVGGRPAEVLVERVVTGTELDSHGVTLVASIRTDVGTMELRGMLGNPAERSPGGCDCGGSVHAPFT
jgi:hypothetical protein